MGYRRQVSRESENTSKSFPHFQLLLGPIIGSETKTMANLIFMKRLRNNFKMFASGLISHTVSMIHHCKGMVLESELKQWKIKFYVDVAFNCLRIQNWK